MVWWELELLTEDNKKDPGGSFLNGSVTQLEDAFAVSAAARMAACSSVASLRARMYTRFFSREEAWRKNSASFEDEVDFFFSNMALTSEWIS